jgi:segregation and condensation protein B
MSKPTNLKSAIESVLFFYGEPIDLKKISKVLNSDEEEVRNALMELQKEYLDSGRGLAILQKENDFQMVTSPQNAQFLKELVSAEMHEELTPAAVETMAIVAYRGPMTRSEIDYIRGVNSSFIIRNLLIRGLIERRVNEKDSRSFIYNISFEFLKLLGVTRVEDLPNFEELSKKEIV